MTWTKQRAAECYWSVQLSSCEASAFNSKVMNSSGSRRKDGEQSKKQYNKNCKKTHLDLDVRDVKQKMCTYGDSCDTYLLTEL